MTVYSPFHRGRQNHLARGGFVMYTRIMESASSLFLDYSVKTETSRSPRNALLKVLYSLYVSQPEETKKENRRRYHEYVRLHHSEVCRKIGFSKERYNNFKSEFKSAKLPALEKFIPIFSEKYFAIKMAHIKGDEGLETLSYMISIARDKLNREENVASYILGSIKIKE